MSPNSGLHLLSGPRLVGIALRQRVAPTGAFLFGGYCNDKRARAYV